MERLIRGGFFTKARNIFLITVLIFSLAMPSGLAQPDQAEATPIHVGGLLAGMLAGGIFEVVMYVVEVQHDEEMSFTAEGFCDAFVLGAAEGLIITLAAMVIAHFGAAAGAPLAAALTAWGGKTVTATAATQFMAEGGLTFIVSAESIAELKSNNVVLQWIKDIKDKIKELTPCLDLALCSFFTANNPVLTLGCVFFIDDLKQIWWDSYDNGDLDGIKSLLQENVDNIGSSDFIRPNLVESATAYFYNSLGYTKTVYGPADDIYLSYNITFNDQQCEDYNNNGSPDDTADLDFMETVFTQIYTYNGAEKVLIDSFPNQVIDHRCNIGGTHTRVIRPRTLLNLAGLSEANGGTVNVGIEVSAYDSGMNLVSTYQSVDSFAKIRIAGDSVSFDNPTVSPAAPTISNDVTFSVQYNNSTGLPLDPNSMKVVVDDSELAMTSGSNNSGSTFVSAGTRFSKGLHEYYFQATVNGALYRHPKGEQTLSFLVGDAAPDNLSIQANPGTLSVCDGGSSVITATLKENNVAVQGREVAFVLLDGNGYFSYPPTKVTDQNGQASVTFTPDGTGSADIGAVVSGLAPAQTTVVTGGCDVNIVPSMYLKRCTDTSSTYKIEARITAQGTGDAIQNETARVYVRDLNGNYFGTLEDYDGNSGNPLNTETDHYGDIDVFLTSSAEKDVLVTIEYDGTTKTFQNHVNAGCVPPADILPFTIIPGDAAENDWPNIVSVSPDGNKVALANLREVYIYDVSDFRATGQWNVWHRLSQPSGPDEEVLAVAWSPDGAYLAAGFDDPDNSEEPALMIWNTGPTPSDYTLHMAKMTSENYQGVTTLAWNSGSNQIMTGEYFSDTAGTGGYARIWNVNTKSNTWTSPRATDDVNAVAWSNQNYKAVGLNEGRVWIYNSSNSRTANFVSWDSGEQVQSVEWNVDGTKLAVGTDNSGSHSPILVYNTSGAQVSGFSEHVAPVLGLDWHKDTGMASVGLSGSPGAAYVKLWSDSGAELISFPAQAYSTDLEWSPEGDLIYVFNDGAGVHIYAPYDSEGPEILITAPLNNTQVASGSITVSGTIKDLQLVSQAAITVNNSTVESIPLNADGTFSIDTALAEGTNTLLLSAIDSSGNTSTKSLTVVLHIPNPDFILSSTTPSQRITSGATARYDISLLSVDGFNSSVNLAVSGLPEHVIATLDASEVIVPATVQLDLSSSLSATTGASEIILQAEGGGKSHQITLGLLIEHVGLAGDFNNNEKIDLVDVITVLQLISGNDAFIVNQASSRSLSGTKVTLDDAIYCLQVVSGLRQPQAIP